LETRNKKKKKKKKKVIGSCLAEEFGKGFRIGVKIDVGKAATFSSDCLNGLDGTKRGE